MNPYELLVTLENRGKSRKSPNSQNGSDHTALHSRKHQGGRSPIVNAADGAIAIAAFSLGFLRDYRIVRLL